MLFHTNTEVFAYNSIKNRHEILMKSLYSYRLCSKCSPSASTQANRRVAIDQWCHQQCAVPVHTTRWYKTLSQLVSVMHSGLVHTLLHRQPGSGQLS